MKFHGFLPRPAPQRIISFILGPPPRIAISRRLFIPCNIVDREQWITFRYSVTLAAAAAATVYTENRAYIRTHRVAV